MPAYKNLTAYEKMGRTYNLMDQYFQTNNDSFYLNNIEDFVMFSTLWNTLHAFYSPNVYGVYPILSAADISTIKRLYEQCQQAVVRLRQNLSTAAPNNRKGQSFFTELERQLNADIRIVKSLDVRDNLNLPTAVYKNSYEVRQADYVEGQFKEPGFFEYKKIYLDSNLTDDEILEIYKSSSRQKVLEDYQRGIENSPHLYEFVQMPEDATGIILSNDKDRINEYLNTHNDQLNFQQKTRLRKMVQSIDNLSRVEGEAQTKMAQGREMGEKPRVIRPRGSKDPNACELVINMPSYQTSGNGCWSCGAQMLVNSRGIQGVTQENIRAYRAEIPDNELFENYKNIADQYLKDQGQTFMNMADATLRYAPNTMVHELTVQQYMREEEKRGISGAVYVANTVKVIQKAIIHAITVEHSPVVFHKPNHYITIIGIDGDTVKYKDSSYVRGGNPNTTHTASLKDLVKNLVFCDDINKRNSVEISWISDIKLSKDGKTIHGIPSKYTKANPDGTLQLPPNSIQGIGDSANLDSNINKYGKRIYRPAGDEDVLLEKKEGNSYSDGGIVKFEKVYIPEKLNYNYLKTMAQNRSNEEEETLDQIDRNYWGVDKNQVLNLKARNQIRFERQQANNQNQINNQINNQQAGGLNQDNNQNNNGQNNNENNNLNNTNQNNNLNNTNQNNDLNNTGQNNNENNNLNNINQNNQINLNEINTNTQQQNNNLDLNQTMGPNELNNLMNNPNMLNNQNQDNIENRPNNQNDLNARTQIIRPNMQLNLGENEEQNVNKEGDEANKEKKSSKKRAPLKDAESVISSKGIYNKLLKEVAIEKNKVEQFSKRYSLKEIKETTDALATEINKNRHFFLSNTKESYTRLMLQLQEISELADQGLQSVAKKDGKFTEASFQRMVALIDNAIDINMEYLDAKYRELTANPARKNNPDRAKYEQPRIGAAINSLDKLLDIKASIKVRSKESTIKHETEKKASIMKSYRDVLVADTKDVRTLQDASYLNRSEYADMAKSKINQVEALFGTIPEMISDFDKTTVFTKNEKGRSTFRQIQNINNSFKAIGSNDPLDKISNKDFAALAFAAAGMDPKNGESFKKAFMVEKLGKLDKHINTVIAARNNAKNALNRYMLGDKQPLAELIVKGIKDFNETAREGALVKPGANLVMNEMGLRMYEMLNRDHELMKQAIMEGLKGEDIKYLRSMAIEGKYHTLGKKWEKEIKTGIKKAWTREEKEERYVDMLLATQFAEERTLCDNETKDNINYLVDEEKLDARVDARKRNLKDAYVGKVINLLGNYLEFSKIVRSYNETKANALAVADENLRNETLDEAIATFREESQRYLNERQESLHEYEKSLMQKHADAIRDVEENAKILGLGDLTEADKIKVALETESTRLGRNQVFDNEEERLTFLSDQNDLKMYKDLSKEFDDFNKLGQDLEKDEKTVDRYREQEIRKIARKYRTESDLLQNISYPGNIDEQRRRLREYVKGSKAIDYSPKDFYERVITRRDADLGEVKNVSNRVTDISTMLNTYEGMTPVQKEAFAKKMDELNPVNVRLDIKRAQNLAKNKLEKPDELDGARKRAGSVAKKPEEKPKKHKRDIRNNKNARKNEPPKRRGSMG